MSKAGEFELTVSEGGHPIWVRLSHGNECLGNSFNALELADLAYAVERARMEARHIARRMDPSRVADY